MKRLLFCLLIVAGFAGFAVAASPEAGSGRQHGKVEGRLTQVELPDSDRQLAALPAAVAPGSDQLVVVVPVSSGSSLAYLYALERSEVGWTAAAGPMNATLGGNGFAKPGLKREGDGHTPSGLFPLEFAFGYAPAINSRMPYRQATADDLWVDDVASPDYNRWVRRGSTNAKLFEQMRLPDHRYRHGLVIGYNRNPVTPGLGSAIFIHVWREAGAATTGCVALAEADLVELLAWLDPARKPAILMGDPADLAEIPGDAFRMKHIHQTNFWKGNHRGRQ